MSEEACVGRAFGGRYYVTPTNAERNQWQLSFVPDIEDSERTPYVITIEALREECIARAERHASDSVEVCWNEDEDDNELVARMKRMFDEQERMMAALPDERAEEFQECASCAAKSGSPLLCESCLSNRLLIDRLRRARSNESHPIYFSEQLHFEEATVEPDGQTRIELLGGHKARLTFVILEKDREKFLKLCVERSFSGKRFALLLTDEGP